MQELAYIRCGDYYIPDIRLPEENRPIGRWGRMHRDHIMEHKPIRFNDLCLSGELWMYLADLNEQAQNRIELVIEQMKDAESVTESMKATDQMAWVGAMNSIRTRAEMSVPRDRKSEFEPKLRKKNQTGIRQDVEEKILSMYAKGMTTSDIEAHIQDIYGVEVFDTTVSRITDKILPVAKEWKPRAAGGYRRGGVFPNIGR